jgi:hypothetical protein
MSRSKKHTEQADGGSSAGVDDLLPQPNWPEGDHAAGVEALKATLKARPDFAVTDLAWSPGLPTRLA